MRTVEQINFVGLISEYLDVQIQAAQLNVELRSDEEAVALFGLLTHMNIFDTKDREKRGAIITARDNQQNGFKVSDQHLELNRAWRVLSGKLVLENSTL